MKNGQPKEKACSKVQFSAFRFVSPHLAHNEGANLLVGVSGNNKGLCVDLPSSPVDTKGPVPVLREVSPPQKNDEGAGRHHRESGQNSTSWE